MTEEESLYVKCAERVALLESLGNIPARPSRNSRPPTGRPTASYVLAEDTERHLASDLAMISSIKRDPNKVTAVCVCEEPPSLSVLVAANARSSHDSPYLQEIKKGLERIFDIFKQVSKISKSDAEHRVFMAITAMCRQRIIGRARIGIFEEKTRFTVFLEAVCNALEQFVRTRNQRAVEESLRELLSRMKSYQEKSSRANHDQVRCDSQLAEIIENCQDLRRIPMWNEVINRATDRLEPPQTAVDAIIIMVNKLAQYKRAAIRLTKIARSKAIVRRANVKLVRLSDNASARDCIESAGNVEGPKELLVQIAAAHGKQVDFGNILKRIKKTENSVKDHYHRTLQEPIRGNRIHAEVQLIWYLDSNSSSTPPRFLSSNKDACYLCNAFILSHGVYTIPRSHGRVYAGWRLPVTGLKNSQVNFIRDLELIIVNRAREIMGGAVTLTVPKESTVNSSMSSLSAALTVEDETEVEDLVEEEEEEASGDSDSDTTVRPDSHNAPGSVAPRSDVALAADLDSGSGIEVNATVGLAAGLEAGNDGVSTAPAGPVDMGIGVEDADSKAPTNIELGLQLTTSQFQSRTGSRSLELKGERENHGESDNPWQTRKVKPGRATILRLSDQLHLHIEYENSCSHGYNCIPDAGTGSGGLSVRYRRLSAANMDTMRIPRNEVYDVRRDLLPLHDVACRTNTRFVHLKAPDDGVFQIDLGCPA